MENEVKQFNQISGKYASFVDEDPIRNFLHYPSVIKLIGSLSNNFVLDIGCGDGLFDRKLAELGSSVVGYDKAADLISIAKKSEAEKPMGNQYFVADPLSFDSKERFDNAVSVMVLSYAPDSEYIVNFFHSAHKHLKNNGKFISVIFNPNFTLFGEVVANRIFRKLSDNKVEVNFLNPKEKTVKFTAQLSQFTASEYEQAAQRAGFKKVSWESLHPSELGLATLGEEFWSLCEEKQPYQIFITEK